MYVFYANYNYTLIIGTYGYHYHAQLLNMTFPTTAYGYTAGNSYIAYLNGPYYCKSTCLNLFHLF